MIKRDDEVWEEQPDDSDKSKEDDGDWEIVDWYLFDISKTR